MPKNQNVSSEPADPGVPVCCNCALQIDCVTVIPFTTTDGEGGKREVWCPQCFCWHRAPLEPERYYPGQFLPVRCDRCGIVAVSVGDPHCMTCSAHGLRSTVRTLGPVTFKA